MRGRRKLWIAREVSCRSSGNVTAEQDGAFYTKRALFLHGGVIFDGKAFLLQCIPLHDCIELTKCWTGSGTLTPGWLKRHELIGWLVGREGVEWGHFGRPFHPTHDAWRDIAMLPDVDIV